MAIIIDDWGKTHDGKDVKLFTVTNAQGNIVKFTNYGATWVCAIVPDKENQKADVVLGFSNLESYLSDTNFIGATVGRFANRIENAQFTIDGHTYKLSANNPPHILHGGDEGFNKRVWDYEIEDDKIIFKLFSPDGDQGFPGAVNVQVSYQWSDENELNIVYTAKTDKATHINLTNHAYFNLRGDDSEINNQMLQIFTDSYLPMKKGTIVSGDVVKVKGTPFDFSTAKALGTDINDVNEQFEITGGYDHSFLLKTENSDALVLAAEAYDPLSGRVMEVYTTYPSVHLYTANFLEGTANGKNGKPYKKREAFCLEAQYLPNTPNNPDFPDSILYPYKDYEQIIRFKFFTK